jgi:hypothetical protein
MNDGMNNLINATPAASRRCKYPSCDGEILADSPFEYCERCRSLAARNAISLRIDPCSPSDMERGKEVIFTMLTNMKGDEILTTCRRIEEVYLQFQQFIKVHNVESSTKRPFKPLPEQIEEARNKNGEAALTEKKLRAKVDRHVKQRVSKMDDLQKLFPKMTREQIKEMMDDKENEYGGL